MLCLNIKEPYKSGIAIVLCRHLRSIQVQYTKSHLSPDEIKFSYVNCITMVLI